MMIAEERKTCRVCRADLPPPFLDLGDQTLANNLCGGPATCSGDDHRVPLAMTHCGSCGLVQLTHVVDPDVLFAHYLYTPSGAQAMRDHFEELADTAAALFPIGSAPKKVLDIGSNDGLLLSYFQKIGWGVQGIDPAANLAADANARGIPTRCAFWGPKEAVRLRESSIGRVDVITACNVFAHTDDWHGFMQGVHEIRAPGGVLVIEAPYLAAMLRDGTFDLGYHEHLSFPSLEPVARLARDHDLKLFDAEIVPVHGGSMRYYIGRGVESSDRFRVLLSRERHGGGCSRLACDALADRAKQTRHQLETIVGFAKERGERVIGYGAPAKATVLVNFCEFDASHLDYIIDGNPLKQGKFLPGSHIPVVSEAVAVEYPPDVVIVFPWNLIDEIVPKVRAIAPKARIICPMPYPREVT